jgi:long-chain acyl-CoA synthetase
VRAVLPPTTRGPQREPVLAMLDRCADATGLPGSRLIDLDEAISAMGSLGLRAGSAVVLAVSSSRNLLSLHFAALLCGLTPLAVPAVSRSGRLHDLARVTGASLLIAARPPTGQLGGTDAGPIGPYRAVRLRAGRCYPAGSVLMATSGTSGPASACVQHWDSLLRNASRHAGAVGLRAQDTMLVSLPLFYSFALVAQAYAALVTGARLVIVGPPFVAPSYLSAVVSHGITSCSVTPTAARMLLAHGQALGASVRMITVGGDQLPPEQVRALLSMNPGRELYLTYGLTEAGPRVATLAAHAEPDSRLDSVGTPLPNTFVHLGNPQADGTGELMVESDTIASDKIGGSSTRRSLVAPGVLATGDRFGIDGRGYLRFLGRHSDFVVVRGEKVNLTAIRAIAQRVTGVVGSSTSISLVDGEHQFDLTVRASQDCSRVEREVRAALAAQCLIAERPRSITVIAHAADPEFRK